MTIVLDAGVLVALLDAQDPRHGRAKDWYAGVAEELVTTPIAVAEADRTLARRAGHDGRRVLWDDLEAGAFRVRWWADALTETVAIARRHPDAGFADASLVALARLERTDRIATFDDDFRSMTLPDGGGLTLIPHDET